MAILDELTEQEVSKNKAIRGYIVRALAKGSQNALLVRQITNALVADGLIYSPDISKPIEYLQEAGYVTFTDRSVNAYNAYRKDSIIKLTRKGVDLVEGTINDPGLRRSDGGRGSARRSTSSRTILRGNSTSGLRTPPTPMKNWRHGSRLKATRSVSQRSGAMRSAPHRRRSA